MRRFRREVFTTDRRYHFPPMQVWDAHRVSKHRVRGPATRRAGGKAGGGVGAS